MAGLRFAYSRISATQSMGMLPPSERSDAGLYD